MTGRVEGLDELVADLTAAPRKVAVGAVAVVTKAAVNIRDDARRFASGIAHAPAYPASITYDLDVSYTTGDVRAEIGPDKDRTQGALGNILEYGTSKNAPLSHLGPALDIEGPRLVDGMADMAGRVLG